MGTHSERRLAAIVAADVVGYSRLVAEDEDGTIRAYRALRADVVEPAMQRHGGRLANTAGDSLLMEFRSAVDAVRCAHEIQTGTADRAQRQHDAKPIAFRMGINVGDIVSDGDDILGDGVNIAARLEALAEPGGILASKAVADNVDGKVELHFHRLGQRQLKNMDRPVEVFELRDTAPAVRRVRVSGRVWGLAAVALGALWLGGMAWWAPWEPDIPKADMSSMAFPLPDKPSIAVLPFATQSQGASQTFLAQGLAEDLITDLSKVSGLFVIASHSSFVTNGLVDSIDDFAEELGVRYVVDGSVRPRGEGLRLSLRLVDVTTGQQVWGARFDGSSEEIFATQDDFVMAITDALELSLPDTEMAEIKRAETRLTEARAAFLRGWALYANFNEADNLSAIPFFERAIELDPDYGRAYGALALAHLRPHIFPHWRGFFDAGEELHVERFYEYYAKAVEHETPLIHVIRAMMILNRAALPLEGIGGNPNQAIAEATKAIALAPNDPEAHIVMAWAMTAANQPDEGVVFAENAMRLNPNYPSHFALIKAAAQYATGDIPAALRTVQLGLDLNPTASELYPLKAALHAINGQRREASEAVDTWRRGEPEAARLAAVEKQYLIVRWSGEFASLNRRLKDGLRLAALSSSTTIASLRAELQNGDTADQRRVARDLGLFGPEAAPAVDDLIGLLSSPSTFVQKEAVIALGKIGPPAQPAVDRLAAMVADTLVGQHAKIALERIREPDG